MNSNILKQVIDLFLLQNWPIEEENLFNRFCKMLTHFSEDQQICILALSKNFLKIDSTKYFLHLKKILTNIPNSKLTSIERIYILPLNSKDDYGKEKSSNFVYYMFLDSEIASQDKIAHCEIIGLDKPDLLPRNFNNLNTLLFVVDDFIGSGEKAIDCLDYLNEMNIDPLKILVLSIVIQRQGFDCINKRSIEIYYSVIRNRGISDLPEPIKTIYTEVMISIENKLNVSPDFKFGYNQSEALVKMVHTPNNTFPVYWYNQAKINGEKYPAPFPRIAHYPK